MKPGSSEFSNPNPYNVQAPMDAAAKYIEARRQLITDEANYWPRDLGIWTTVIGVIYSMPNPSADHPARRRGR